MNDELNEIIHVYEVYDAVENKNVPLLTKLVASGVHVDHVTEEGLTPLIRALQLHVKALVMVLLERASLNWFPHCATSPLAAAVEFYPEMVSILIEKGASLHSNVSAIAAAVKANNPKMLRYLLSKGAPINGGDIPPLHQAIMTCNLAMVELVLAEGAFIDWQDSSGTTPLLLAISTEEVEVVDVLLGRQANLEIANQQGITPLMSAAGYGDAKIVDLLLQYDADVGHTTNNGLTPLHMAAYANSMVCAHMLMTQGAHVNAVDATGNTPLMIATRNEDSDDMVVLLLDMNANVNIVAANGVTALFRAISNDNVGTVTTLLRRGASINHPLPDGTTPVHTAVFLQNEAMVDAFLQHGANVDLTMLDGTAPIHSAVRMRSLYIVEQLLAHGCSQGGVVTPLHIAAEIGAYEHAKLLLRYKAEVNAVDRYGAPPIEYAIENDHVPVTILLLSAGALFSINQISDFAPFLEWALGHTSDVNGLALVSTSPVASRVVDCADLMEVIHNFLLPPNVTALAWRVVESIS
jgi:ankyrin repeat protein